MVRHETKRNGLVYAGGCLLRTTRIFLRAKTHTLIHTPAYSLSRAFTPVACAALALMLIGVPALSGCTSSANASEPEAEVTLLPNDEYTRAVQERPIILEQLNLKKEELKKKEAELVAAEGMLKAQQEKAHPDEQLIATYEKLVEKTKVSIAALKQEIAYLEDYLANIDKLLHEATDADTSKPEDDPLKGENAPDDIVIEDPFAEDYDPAASESAAEELMKEALAGGAQGAQNAQGAQAAQNAQAAQGGQQNSQQEEANTGTQAPA